MQIEGMASEEMVDVVLKSWPYDCGKEAGELLDLLPVHGAEPWLVKMKAPDLSSPPPPLSAVAIGVLPSFTALVPGSHLNLWANFQGRGFLRADHRFAAFEHDQERPYFVVGSHLFRNLRAPGMDPTEMKK